MYLLILRKKGENMKKLFSIIAIVSTFLIVNSVLADINEGLVAYYPFNGNADDQTGNGHNGTVYGATLTNGHLENDNGAYNFDGNDYIEIPGNQNLYPGNHDYSISVWIKSSARPSQFMNIVYNQESWSNDAVVLSLSPSGQVTWVFHDNNGGGMCRIDTTQTVTDGEWHHISAIRNRSKNVSQVYIDSILAGEAQDTNANVVIPLRNKLYIGKRGNIKSERYFNGVIDEVRIYNKALSNNDIQELYNKNSLVSGCINLKDNPIQNGKAMLMQSGEIFQSTPLDKNGCYKFYKVDEDKPFGVMIRRLID